VAGELAKACSKADEFVNETRSESMAGAGVERGGVAAPSTPLVLGLVLISIESAAFKPFFPLAATHLVIYRLAGQKL
jgi:hypothetical protein